MGQGDAGSVQDGLSQLVVVGLGRVGGSLEGIPDLLAALEGGRRVPELIPLAPQLPVGHRIVALPLQPLLLQGLVASWAGQREKLCMRKARTVVDPLTAQPAQSSLLWLLNIRVSGPLPGPGKSLETAQTPPGGENPFCQQSIHCLCCCCLSLNFTLFL